MTEHNKNTSLKPLFILAFILVLADQITKLYFKGFNFLGIEHLGYNYGEQNPVIDGILYWTYIENPGMAFGIQFGWAKIFLSLFSIFASIGLVYLLIKIKDRNIWVRIGFSLILAGAVGNLIDRVFYGVIFGESPLFYGKVVDFIQVNIPDIAFLGWTHFPVFNIADSCVTVGVSFLILFHNHIPDFGEIFGKKKNESVTNSTEENLLQENAE